MNITGRLLGWVLPGVLCCGGCATHSLVEPSTAATPQIASEDIVPSPPDASQPTVQPRAEADGAAREAAAIRGAVQKQGYSEESASRFAEAVLGAYTELCRDATTSTAGTAPSPMTDEGVPLSPVETVSTPSPAAAEAPGVSPTLLPSKVADLRAARPASSVFSPAPAPNDTQKSPPAPPTVSVAVGAPRPRPTTDVAHQPPVVPRPGEQRILDTPVASAEARPALPTSHTTDSPDGSAAKSSDTDQPPNSWRRQIKLAVEQLREEMDNGTLDDTQRARCQVYLSLLLLAEEDPEKAVAALEDFDDQQLEFWRQTVLGMGILLDSDELPKFRHRIDSASEHLSRAVSSLSALGPLSLSHLAFCTKVNGFGDFVDCSAYGLEPGKPVILYVEVENYTVEPIEAEASQNGGTRDTARQGTTRANGTPKYATELHGRYEILDANQQTIASRILPVGRDECRNRRRDYYISYVVYLPEHIQPGAYTLELTIEDKKGAKFGNAVIDFRVK